MGETSDINYQALQEARAILGDAAFEAAYLAGQAIQQEDAITLALEAHSGAVVAR